MGRQYTKVLVSWAGSGRETTGNIQPNGCGRQRGPLLSVPADLGGENTGGSRIPRFEKKKTGGASAYAELLNDGLLEDQRERAAGLFILGSLIEVSFRLLSR